MWKAGFKWMFLIIDTTIGAGYASGQELWQYFGHDSSLAILLFVIFFIVSCYVIMYVSFFIQSSDNLPVLRDIIVEKLSGLYDILILLYLFTTSVVMIAGSGATGQAFNISYWCGVIIISIALIIIFFRDINALLSINQYFIPLLLVGLLFVLFLFTFDQKLP